MKIELIAESVAIYPASMPGIVEVAFTSTNVNDDFSILTPGPINFVGEIVTIPGQQYHESGSPSPIVQATF